MRQHLADVTHVLQVDVRDVAHRQLVEHLLRHRQTLVVVAAHATAPHYRGTPGTSLTRVWAGGSFIRGRPGAVLNGGRPGTALGSRLEMPSSGAGVEPPMPGPGLEQGHSDGGSISVYIHPQNQCTKKFLYGCSSPVTLQDILNSALHPAYSTVLYTYVYVAIATKPGHRLQIRRTVHS